MSEEDQALIDLYGPKIKVVKWMFQNDEVVQKLLSNYLKNGGFGGIGGSLD